MDKSFRELHRVLKPFGKLVIFTSTAEQMKGYWLYHYFPKMMQDSMNQMPKFEHIKNNLLKNGFQIIETENYFVREDLQDLFLYSGKDKPEIYLDKEFRQGISSFSDLANDKEVEIGLEKLEEDILSGKVKDIITQYENDSGDYLFIVGQKK